MAGFGASIRSVSRAVTSPASRVKRFTQTARSIDAVARTTTRQPARTSESPARSIGTLKSEGRYR